MSLNVDIYIYTYMCVYVLITSIESVNLRRWITKFYMMLVLLLILLVLSDLLDYIVFCGVDFILLRM